MVADPPSNFGQTPAEESVAMSEEDLFTEKKEAFEFLNVISSQSFSSSVEQRNYALSKLRNIFDNYLECPTLLDRHLGEIIAILLQAIRPCICSHTPDKVVFDNCSHALSVIYVLSKVRGSKYIKKFLPHEVEDVEPVLKALQQLSQEIEDRKDSGINSGFSNDSGPQQWESLYVLWLWMGTQSLVPFDCAVVLDDSHQMVDAMIELAKKQLCATGPTRGASASCLSAWLSRPDLEEIELPKFVDWSKSIIESASSSGNDIFLLLGVLQTLVTILKVSTGSRDEILRYMAPLWELMIILAESNVCDKNLLLRKLMVKWWSRMGCVYLPPKVAEWRYQRGRRFLQENLRQTQSTFASCVHKEDKGHQSQRPQSAQAGLPEIPDRVEDSMGFIIAALSDPSTVVRWSAAKGVGRLTERLPSICADDVVDAILELFLDLEADRSWHGACLALAELARRGLLLPNRLDEVVPLVVRAIQFDVRRGQTSVGGHVRDAACYTYWSFARAYSPADLKPYISVLSESIVLTCLFDREVNCRRAASAAFQECVGRQGADNFKHGISILTTADYCALGNRKNSFTQIAFQIAQFAEYRRTIIIHVHSVKLLHWDENVRTLASKSLNQLTPLDSKYAVDTIIPSLVETSVDPHNVHIRHGSILGLAESILAIGQLEEKIESTLPKDLMQAIIDIVPKIEKKRLYRGKGGEIIRGAVCRLIACICSAKIPLLARNQVRFLDSIDSCLHHPNESIQKQACAALRQLTKNYFPVTANGPSERLQNRVVDKYLGIVNIGENPASTRGFALALGHLPGKLLAPNRTVLESVLACLRQVSYHKARVGTEKDAETRRNALISLRNVSQTVGLAPSVKGRDNEVPSGICTGMDSRQVQVVFAALFAGLEDYNVDRRGDVGSWCRIEAMRGLETMTNLVIDQIEPEKLPDIFDLPIFERIAGSFLKQLSEKLDRARVEAGGCLERILLKRDPLVPIPEAMTLTQYLCLEQENEQGHECIINWADASVTFPMLAKVATLDIYFPQVIAGLVTSVGGLTESVAKHSSAALLQLVKQSKGSKRMVDLGNVFLGMFECHCRDGRVILPLLKTVDFLLTHQCLDELVQDTSQDSFMPLLLAHLGNEASSCSDVHRLFACIDVALGFIGTSTPCSHTKAFLTFACSMLVHRFPRVRRYAAEHIYICLLEQPDLLAEHEDSGPCSSNCEFQLDVMLSFGWDDDSTSIQRCREMAQNLADILQVELPKTMQETVSGRKRNDALDDFATYAALVGTL